MTGALITFVNLPADQRDHSVGCPECVFHADGSVTLCAAAPMRLRELLLRGFTRACSIQWIQLEVELGYRVCYHIAAGCPECMSSGKCATCWTLHSQRQPLVPPIRPTSQFDHQYNDDGSDPGNCSVCHFYHK